MNKVDKIIEQGIDQQVLALREKLREISDEELLGEKLETARQEKIETMLEYYEEMLAEVSDETILSFERISDMRCNEIEKRAKALRETLTEEAKWIVRSQIS
jgi:demethoxyubiquinone hydroxylase (CLK1/Coq7/Cat5 family)